MKLRKLIDKFISDHRNQIVPVTIITFMEDKAKSYEPTEIYLKYLEPLMPGFAARLAPQTKLWKRCDKKYVHKICVDIHLEVAKYIGKKWENLKLLSNVPEQSIELLVGAFDEFAYPDLWSPQSNAILFIQQYGYIFHPQQCWDRLITASRSIVNDAIEIVSAHITRIDTRINLRRHLAWNYEEASKEFEALRTRLETDFDSIRDQLAPHRPTDFQSSPGIWSKAACIFAANQLAKSKMKPFIDAINKVGKDGLVRLIALLFRHINEN